MSRKKALENYVEVKDRLKLYREEYPDYRIITDVIYKNEAVNVVMVKAWLYKNKEELQNGTPHSTGIAEETRDAGFINKTSHVENCETSAIGRALANADYSGGDQRPSREEMSKVERTKKAKEKKKEEPKEEPPFEPDDEDYSKVINDFEDTDSLVEWFNEQLDKRDGKDKSTFRDRYLKEVRERASTLYDA